MAADAMQVTVGLLTASLDSPELEAWAVQALIPEDPTALGDFIAGLRVVSLLLLHELQNATGRPSAVILQELAILAETRRRTFPPSQGGAVCLARSSPDAGVPADEVSNQPPARPSRRGGASTLSPPSGQAFASPPGRAGLWPGWVVLPTMNYYRLLSVLVDKSAEDRRRARTCSIGQWRG